MQIVKGDAAAGIDEADRELVARLHPPAWANPVPAPTYDVVVLGGGTAGLVSAMGRRGSAPASLWSNATCLAVIA